MNRNIGFLVKPLEYEMYDVFRVSDFFYENMGQNNTLTVLDCMGLIYVAHGYRLSCINHGLIKDKFLYTSDNKFNILKIIQHYKNEYIDKPYYKNYKTYKFDNETHGILVEVVNKYCGFDFYYVYNKMCEQDNNSPFMEDVVKKEYISNSNIKLYFDTILGVNL
jgi:uncharacterized phage-associated protein